jgi:hypothetical protein
LVVSQVSQNAPHFAGFIWNLFDKLSSTGGWRYLDAAPKAAEQKLPYGDIHPGPGETGLGTGKKNTQTLVEKGRGSLIAAQFCNDLEYGGYDDWFLPSRDELELMYTNLKAKRLGEFSDTRYWSSTYHNGNYWGPIWVDFSNGNRDTAYFTGKTTPELFRAVRQF